MRHRKTAECNDLWKTGKMFLLKGHEEGNLTFQSVTLWSYFQTFSVLFATCESLKVVLTFEESECLTL